MTTTELNAGQPDAAVELEPVGHGASGVVSFGSALIGLLAVSCCALPLILMGLGMGGAFASSLMSLAPYREYFAIAALLVFVGGAYMVYLRPRMLCAQGKACAADGVRLPSIVAQVMLWLAVVFAALAFAYPYYEDWLISMM